jgi:hypothetical protein
MKDALLLHDNAGPDTSLRTREAITKMGWTVLAHPAHSPNRSPSDYDVFHPVKDALLGRHFADDNETEFSLCALKSRDGILQHWYTAFTQRWRKCVESEGGFVEK